MTTTHELDRCYSKLFYYDVTQNGWEHEHKGFDANIKHTLSHFVKDSWRKNFNSELAETAIAPDNLMYAIRFCRWGKVPIKQLVSSDTSTKLAIDRRNEYFNELPPAFVAHFAAMDSTADLIHEEDHTKSRQQALSERFNKVLYTGRLLLHSANLLAEEHDFDLESAFDNRLFELRERFCIEQPKVIQE